MLAVGMATAVGLCLAGLPILGGLAAALLTAVLAVLAATVARGAAGAGAAQVKRLVQA